MNKIHFYLWFIINGIESWDKVQEAKAKEADGVHLFSPSTQSAQNHSQKQEI